MDSDYIQKYEFSETLEEIEENETNYEIREMLVYKALYQAKQLGYNCGIRFDSGEESWPVVCINLPIGETFKEISWHCPGYDKKFTGYTTEEKYLACKEYSKQFPFENGI